MDNIFIQRMREERRWFLMMSLIYAVVFTFCLYKNMSGITFPVIAAVSLGFSVMFLQKAGIRFQKGTIRYFAGILLLGTATVLTDSIFFHFFNCVGILLLYMMSMAHQIYKDQEWGFAEYVKNFFVMAGTWILSVGEIFHRSGEKRKKDEDNPENKSAVMWIKRKEIRSVLFGILAAVLVLAVVLPLLMASDQIFSHIFNSFFDILNPFILLEKIDVWNILGIVFTFLFGLVFIYAFFAGLFRMNLGGKGEKKQGKTDPVAGITFAGIMAAVYVVYSGIQILFLFLRLDSGLPEGVTYSQYAHQGFWQLLAVSLINFAAVLICQIIFDENRILKGILTVVSACTCIMIVSAAYRMILYVSEYYLTFLRVLVLWFLAVLMIIFFGVIYSIYRRDFGLFRYITAVVSVCYILFSFSRPDTFIAEYNISCAREGSETDVYYLMNLSMDTAPVLAELEKDEISDTEVRGSLDAYFRYILDQQGEPSLREWNYSRAEAGKAAEKWLGLEE